MSRCLASQDVPAPVSTRSTRSGPPSYLTTSFTVTSDDVTDGQPLKDDQVAEFGNTSPQLSWSGAPADAKSFALTMFDPDAPTGSGWWHWVVVNIPASATKLDAGASGKSMPAGALETRTDFGKSGYGGPCPPPGAPHRYVFTVYALKVDKLDLDAQASGAMAGFMLNQNMLSKATLTATYGRK